MKRMEFQRWHVEIQQNKTRYKTKILQRDGLNEWMNEWMNEWNLKNGDRMALTRN